MARVLAQSRTDLAAILFAITSTTGCLASSLLLSTPRLMWVCTRVGAFLGVAAEIPRNTASRSEGCLSTPRACPDHHDQGPTRTASRSSLCAGPRRGHPETRGLFPFPGGRRVPACSAHGSRYQHCQCGHPRQGRHDAGCVQDRSDAHGYVHTEDDAVRKAAGLVANCGKFDDWMSSAIALVGGRPLLPVCDGNMLKWFR